MERFVTLDGRYLLFNDRNDPSLNPVAGWAGALLPRRRAWEILDISGHARSVRHERSSE